MWREAQDEEEDRELGRGRGTGGGEGGREFQESGKSEDERARDLRELPTPLPER